MINKKAVDVYQNKDIEGQKVIVWRKHNGWNQRWRVIYLDGKNYKKERTTGFDKEYGFYINRPFYFRSRLPMQRIVELVPWDCRLRRYYTGRRNQQTWRFDRKSNTIANQNWKNYSIDITSNGNGTNLRVQGTNSRWW
jgi:hypothetical protein